MKEWYTVKEVMQGTGLTRQRVHALIKNRDVKVEISGNKYLIRWNELLKLADNDKALEFLRAGLIEERKEIDNIYKGILKSASEIIKPVIDTMEEELTQLKKLYEELTIHI